MTSPVTLLVSQTYRCPCTTGVIETLMLLTPIVTLLVLLLTSVAAVEIALEQDQEQTPSDTCTGRYDVQSNTCSSSLSIFAALPPQFSLLSSSFRLRRPYNCHSHRRCISFSIAAPAQAITSRTTWCPHSFLNPSPTHSSLFLHIPPLLPPWSHPSALFSSPLSSLLLRFPSPRASCPTLSRLGGRPP
jgi:hypothetical protein